MKEHHKGLWHTHHNPYRSAGSDCGWIVLTLLASTKDTSTLVEVND